MPGPGHPTKLLKPSGIEGEGGAVLTYRDAIYREMEACGLKATACAELVGLPRDTISMWLNEGRKLAEKEQRGHYLARGERLLAEFFRDTQKAHTRWIRNNLTLYDSVVNGGLIEGKIIEEVDPTQTGADGKPLVTKRRVEQAKLLPDPAAIWKKLTTLAKDDGFAERLEVTGADGGPIEVDDRQARVDALLAEADAFTSGAALGAEVEAEKTKQT